MTVKPSAAAPVPTTILRVSCRNGAGLLQRMSAVFAHHGVNILSMNAVTTEDLRGECTFGVRPDAPAQLERVVSELSRLKDVLSVNTETRD